MSDFDTPYINMLIQRANIYNTRRICITSIAYLIEHYKLNSIYYQMYKEKFSF